MDFGFFVILDEHYKEQQEQVIGRYWTYGEATAKLSTEVSRIISELGQAGYTDNLKVVSGLSKDRVTFEDTDTGTLLAELFVDEREV